MLNFLVHHVTSRL